MPRHLITDASEWIDEMPTIGQAEVERRGEREREGERGERERGERDDRETEREGGRGGGREGGRERLGMFELSTSSLNASWRMVHSCTARIGGRGIIRRFSVQSASYLNALGGWWLHAMARIGEQGTFPRVSVQ